MTSRAEILNQPRPQPPSLWHFLEEGASKDPKAAAIGDLASPSDHLAHFVKGVESPFQSTYLTWSYEQLRTAAYRTAAGLLDQGIQRGSKIALFIPNGIEHPLILWVVSILQLTLVPLDTGLLEPGREFMLHFYLTSLGAETFVVDDAVAADRLDEALRQKNLDCSLRIVLGQSSRPGWIGFNNLVSDSPPVTFDNDARLAQDAKLEDNGRRIGVILFTSGTSTGNPKGVPLRVKNLLTSMANRAALPTAGNKGVVSTTYSRAAAWGFTNTLLASGRHIILMKLPFSPENFAGAIEAGGELIFVVPAYVHVLAEDRHLKTRNLSSLRQLVMGGDLMTDAVYRKAQKLFPGVDVITGHGMTEGAGALGWSDHDPLDNLPTYHGVMVIGSPMPGCGARICDTEGNVLQRGEPGHLHLGGPSMIDAYLGNVQPETFYSDDFGNWLHTGDRAVMLEEGQIAILGRSKDVVKRAGASLSPAVIESMLSTQMGLEATVLGIPHDVLGEVPMGVIKDEQGKPLDVEGIKEAVVKSLGPDFALEDVVPLSALGYKEWPLNGSGKIMKPTLKEAVVHK